MTTLMRGMIDFLFEIGLFDIILPFLLILLAFVVLGISAILKKKKVLGILLIIFSFPIAFVVINAMKMISIINQSISQIILFLILLAFGIFWTIKTFNEKKRIKDKRNLFKFYSVFTIIFWVITIVSIITSFLF